MLQQHLLCLCTPQSPVFLAYSIQLLKERILFSQLSEIIDRRHWHIDVCVNKLFTTGNIRQILCCFHYGIQASDMSDHDRRFDQPCASFSIRFLHIINRSTGGTDNFTSGIMAVIQIDHG